MACKIIIIDGTDLSGKDWFNDKISKQLKNSINIKSNYRPEDSTEKHEIKKRYENMFEALKLLNDSNVYDYVILNRFYPSELAYSKVKRNYDAMKDPWFEKFEKRLIKSKLKIVFVLVYEDIKILKERLKERGDEFIVEKDFIPLCDRYNRIFKRSKLKKIKLKSNDFIKFKKFINKIKW